MSVSSPTLPPRGASSTQSPAPSAGQASWRIVEEPPAHPWRRMLADWLLVGGTTVITQVLGTAISLILRKALDPAAMGIWQALKLLLANSNYANMGISKGAARELSIAVGRGNIDDVRPGLNLAFTVNTITSILYGAAVAGAGVWIGLSGSSFAEGWAVGLAVMGLLVVLQRYVTFQVTLMRSAQNFRATAQLSVLEAVLTLVLCGIATWFWRLPGLYGSTVAVMIASTIFLHCRGAFALRLAWNWPEVRRLATIGSPIMLAGVVSTLFRTLDRWMILGYLADGTFQLGCYSLALLVSAQLYGAGNMLATVVGPKLGESLGRNGTVRATASLAARASELQAAALALPGALAVVAVPPLLGWLLPDYRDGLPPMYWLVPGTIALSLALVPSQYLVTVDRQGWNLVAIVLATLFGAAGNYVALCGGWSLVGVALTTSLSYAVYLLLVGGPLWRRLDRSERRRCVAMHSLALVPALAMAALVELLLPAGLSTAVLKGVLVTLAWSVSVACGWQFGGWRDALRKRNQP